MKIYTESDYNIGRAKIEQYLLIGWQNLTPEQTQECLDLALALEEYEFADHKPINI